MNVIALQNVTTSGQPYLDNGVDFGDVVLAVVKAVIALVREAGGEPFVADSPGFLFVGGRFGQARRIVEAHVGHLRVPGKDRAGLVGMAANGDHVVEGDVSELVDVLGAVARDARRCHSRHVRPRGVTP